jgi:hypothetical protein
MKGLEEQWMEEGHTFLPITPRQAIDGIAVAIAARGVEVVASWCMWYEI